MVETLPSTRVREREYLRHHTTFKIGGPADLFVEPTTMAELSFCALRTIHEFDVPVTIVSVADPIFSWRMVAFAVLLYLFDIRHKLWTVMIMYCIGSGYMWKTLLSSHGENGLTGLWVCIGIPGIRGAVFVNAGAYDGEMSRESLRSSCRFRAISKNTMHHLNFESS